ncbi:MAG: M3 family oligoendopeptidase [Leptospirillia bacterium]
MSQPETSAAHVTWDLSDLYAGADDPAIEKDLSALSGDAKAFAGTWRGKLTDAPTASDVARAVSEMEDIYEKLAIIGAFAFLAFSGDTEDPTLGALLVRVREAGTEIRSHLLFFELEWVALPDDAAAALLDDPALARFRHHLIRERDFKPHRRTEGEEAILDEKANTGSSAFSRLFDQSLSRMRVEVELDGELRELSEEEALALLHDEERTVRKAAALGMTRALEGESPLLTFIYNTLMADHASNDRIRAFPGPMTSRNLGNEISQESVDALLDACDRAMPMVQDYYRLKKRLLGLDTLFDYDRYAPVGEAGSVPFDAARKIVLDSFGAFSPDMANIAEMFFERRWIDAEVRDGKRGGAFSHPVAPSRHPYVMLNYQDRPRDVMVLAHELGHGIHQWLARKQGYFGSDTPLTTAETASVFGEMLVFSDLRKSGSDPQVTLTLLCGKLEDTFSTVFRQVAMTRFEQAAHQARRQEGELSTERIGEMWMAANRPMFGDALTLTDDYARWWSYIPHFIHSPFYCYAYAYGELLVLSLYARYLEEGEAFVPRYMDMLAAGGSDRPEALMRRIGVDITAPGFWDGGLKIIEGWVAEAYRHAEAAGAGIR